MSQTRPRITIVVPVYNEAKNVEAFCQAARQTTSPLPYDFDMVFVDDGSTDGSADLLDTCGSKRLPVTVLRLSRNFGKEPALSAGLARARGDAVIVMDADLQHPIEKIPEFIAKWQQGADVVVGVRKQYSKRGFTKVWGSRLFYKVLNAISETEIVPHSTDYRLLSREVVDQFNRLTEHGRMTRGLIAWLGYDRDYVYFKENPRLAGTAGYSVTKLTRLAIASFVANSLFPLRFAGYLGAGISSLAGVTLLFMVVERFILNDPLQLRFTGPAVLAVFIVFLVGIILSALGIIALYIGAIHAEVLNRPLYIIRDQKTKPSHPNRTRP